MLKTREAKVVVFGVHRNFKGPKLSFDRVGWWQSSFLAFSPDLNRADSCAQFSAWFKVLKNLKKACKIENLLKAAHWVEAQKINKNFESLIAKIYFDKRSKWSDKMVILFFEKLTICYDQPCLIDFGVKKKKRKIVLKTFIFTRKLSIGNYKMFWQFGWVEYSELKRKKFCHFFFIARWSWWDVNVL